MRILYRYIHRFVLHVFFVLITFNAIAQKYPFHNLNVENGLLQSQVGALLQDKMGHLWIGTLGGLCRYDGKTFIGYTVRNGLLNNYIRSLATDSHGNIWIGCATGVSEYNGKTFRNYLFQSTDNTVSNDVRQIAVGLQDSIWCVAGGKLYCIANNKIIPIQTQNGDVAISAMLVDKTAIWIAKTNGTISYRNNGKWDSLNMIAAPGSRVPIVTEIYKDHAQRIWLTTTNGLYKMQNHEVVVDTLNGAPLYNLPVLYSITEDNNGALWMGTSSGVMRLNGNLVQYYNKHNGLSDNIFSDVLTDAEGNVWLASDGQGVFRYSGTQFTTLDETMGLPSGQVTAIGADHSGRLYFGTYDAGLAIFDNGKISLLPLPSKSATTSMKVHKGKVWIGTRNGLWRYDNTFKLYTYPERHFPSNVISCLYNDKEDRLWVGFINGAVVLDNDTFKRVPTKGLSVQDFISIGKDSVLMATNAGLKLYNDHNVASYKTNTLLDSADAQCFALRGDELWVGTGDNGVIRFNLDTKKCNVYNKQNGLQSDFIYNIVTDNDGNVWLGTGYGLHKISIDSKGQAVINFYGKGQGVAGMESNHNAVLKMRDSSIWFGTTNGAIHYQPHTAIVAAEPISIVMQSIKLFGVNITDTSYFDSTDSWNDVPYGLHLSYQKNSLTFTFQAISMSGGDQLLYRYYMEGLDAPWSGWSGTNSVTFSALPPGNYTLHVQCITGNSDRQVKDLTYNFTIVTPFQKTGLFRLIILLGCILLGVTIQYIVNTRKQNREKLLRKLRSEEQAKIRMRTAEDFHDEVGNKLTRINVLTNVLKSKIDNVTPDIARILDQIQDNTGQLYSGTKDILWSLKPTNDNMYEILHRVRDVGIELFQYTDTEFIFIGTDSKWQNYRIPLDVSRNIIMIFKEALNNCLKYSKATKVKLEVSFKRRDILQMVLTDNGKGFDLQHVKKGHGIDNMNVRANRIHGKLYIDSAEGRGTAISLTFKIGTKIT